MSKTHANLLAIMVDNYRNHGTFNPASAQEVVKELAKTSLSSQEIATAFQENLLDATAFAEVEEDATTE